MKKFKKSISLSSSGLNSPVEPMSEGLRLNLPDIKELGCLPESGTITFRYTRENLHLPKDGRLSADICLCELLEVEGDEAAEEKKDDVVDKLFEEAQEKE